MVPKSRFLTFLGVCFSRPQFGSFFAEFLIRLIVKNALILCVFFAYFFVFFLRLKTLKIVLSPARELNVYKIAFFALDEKKC